MPDTNTTAEIMGKSSTRNTFEYAHVENNALRATLGNDIVTVHPDPTQEDAFGRMRVSEPYTIFDSKQLYDKLPLFFDEVSPGTAYSNHVEADAAVEMGVLDSGDYVIRQTFMRFNYQPGKSQLILCTGILGDPVTDTESKIGYFNTSTTAPYTANRDGIYFGADGTTAYVAISKSGSETRIDQANWDDPMDGTGASGITLDWESTQIFGMDMEWLGVGSVRFFVFVDDVLIPVHQIDNANTGQTGSYMSSPNHSIRYEIRSTGGVKEMKHMCSTVASEGGFNPGGVTRSFDNDTSSITCGTTLEGILFFRLAELRHGTTLDLDTISILNSSNNANNFKWALVLNPVIAGTALSWVTTPDSAIEYATGQGDNTLTGGTTIESGYGAGSLPSVGLPANLVVNPGVAIDGTHDVIALAIKTFSGTDSFCGAFNIRELSCG